MRKVVAVSAVCGMLMLAGCSRDDAAPALRTEYALAKISERVYVVHGPLTFPNKDNQGFINNPGFVVTDGGVVVIDPGSSVQTGEMLLNKIRSVTAEPVIAVFNTHIHGDHWLANGAIRKAYPRAVIYAHGNMIKHAKAGGAEEWVNLLMDMTGGAIKGTGAVLPDMEVNDAEVLRLGGNQFRIYHTGTAHTDGDIMVEAIEHGVLFLGDNAFNGRAPRLDDGSFKGTIAALDVALKSPARHFVPGHGATGGREVVESFRKFLDTIYQQAKRGYEQGKSDFDLKPVVTEALKPYQKWEGLDENLGKLISLAYLEAEQDAF